ncbi:hypothetical protein W97_06933 [Coniosporium apollinis CBS 100218]|uniref:PLD phosphodiesterase domain-containing protein n=1 Tax=Coniosporium apollinis (strain CBS 100218) TaxID=1168221 RepID=R7Z049_CONA1|nr:uncharacterized protein W97_06933 [Coniosporium apollinis CBS 100218]EON67565.1 hypothetical protein W97_06933 [Coniosporium apollinis CBS 100218]
MAEMSRKPQPKAHSSIGDLVLEEWVTDLIAHGEENRRHPPNYFTSDPSALITTSFAHSFTLGTGNQIFTSIIPAIEAAESEVLIVTCFWARSASLDQLCTALRRLSGKALRRGGSRIRVSICFSSRSLWQKLFQTSSLDGHIYPPKSWSKTLSLPPCGDLGGLDLTVKSVFVRPFSVMHPKFVVVDRRRALLPSCNVSWENWFEGCIELSGPVVSQFVGFWEEFWDQGSNKPPISNGNSSGPARDALTLTESGTSAPPMTVNGYVDILTDSIGNSTAQDQLPTTAPAITAVSLNAKIPLPTVFLPSPHHLNPRFRPFPWQTAAPAPPTPLNTFILHLLYHAQTSIYIQTPNLTSPPILSALLAALRCGIDVHIVTNARLMLLEQLGTAGTTTARCVRKLIKRYRAIAAPPLTAYSLERALPAPGRLRIEYFQPLPTSTSSTSGSRADEEQEPVQSHLKLTIVDQDVTVLGSGNMDRASWYTSQELGVAFFSAELAGRVRGAVEGALRGRKRGVFGDGEGEGRG